MARESQSDRPGLQAERTSLSWERTALALLANGALLLLRGLRGTGWAALPVGALGLVLAVVCAVLGFRRARRIRSDPVRSAPTSIKIMGIAVLVFCAAVTAVLAGGAVA